MSRRWDRITIPVENDGSQPTGEYQEAEAIAPVIISASRATDIPAFYPDWFMARLRKGYVRWINPFSRRSHYISFAKTRAIVFWSKNPCRMIQYLPELDANGMNYYFQFTLNNYEPEHLEPGLPGLDARIKTFSYLADLIGPERVIWRFDPLILSDALSLDTLISRIQVIGDQIHGSTRRLVFSFVDIGAYKKVRENLAKSGFSDVREFTLDEKFLFAQRLKELNRTWNLDLFTCGEEIDLLRYGIRKGHCIDYDLMKHIFYRDRELMEFLRPDSPAKLTGSDPDFLYLHHKDTGQRRECGCHTSKDIGQYNTCMHLCHYCYANRSDVEPKENHERYHRTVGSGHFCDTIIPESD